LVLSAPAVEIECSILRQISSATPASSAASVVSGKTSKTAITTQTNNSDDTAASDADRAQRARDRELLQEKIKKLEAQREDSMKSHSHATTQRSQVLNIKPIPDRSMKNDEVRNTRQSGSSVGIVPTSILKRSSYLRSRLGPVSDLSYSKKIKFSPNMSSSQKVRFESQVKHIGASEPGSAVPIKARILRMSDNPSILPESRYISNPCISNATRLSPSDSGLEPCFRFAEAPSRQNSRSVESDKDKCIRQPKFSNMQPMSSGSWGKTPSQNREILSAAERENARSMSNKFQRMENPQPKVRRPGRFLEAPKHAIQDSMRLAAAQAAFDLVTDNHPSCHTA
jgi:hypothetical protein